MMTFVQKSVSNRVRFVNHVVSVAGRDGTGLSVQVSYFVKERDLETGLVEALLLQQID